MVLQKESVMQTLNIKALSLSMGVTWGVSCLFMGWTAAFDWGDYFVDVMGSFYLGYRPGFMGGIAGAVWGFIDGAIGGAILSFLYNYFSHQDKKR